MPTSRKLAPSKLFLAFFLLSLPGCAIKPKPIYKIYDHENTRGSEPENRDAEADPSREAGNDQDARYSKNIDMGDEGVDASEATYIEPTPKTTYPLAMSAKVWKLATELVPFLHTPYRYGGEDTTGVDCSGLVKVVYERAFDLSLPHKAALQYKMGRPVSKKRLVPGDLVFFYKKNSRRIGHVGLYLSDNQFIHAIGSKGVVLSNLAETYWRKHYAGARRMLQE